MILRLYTLLINKELKNKTKTKRNKNVKALLTCIYIYVCKTIYSCKIKEAKQRIAYCVEVLDHVQVPWSYLDCLENNLSVTMYFF